MTPIRNLPTPPFHIETYNLITTKWNSQEDSVPLEKVWEFESRLWPDGLPAYSISLPGHQSPWDYYFSGCVVDDIVFRCQAEDGKLFISVRSLDHIAEHDAKFVSYHRIDLNHCLTGYCDLHYPTCFLNHITGFKFCLVLFFSDFMLQYATTSVCILTVELAKGNQNVRIQDDPDQSKARKGQMDLFKIESILNKSSFNLPNTGIPISCVKQENPESSKNQLFEIYDQNTEKQFFHGETAASEPQETEGAFGTQNK
ncbi:hypothetical protein LIER_12417 [Lithospermum erythrorhizon]|uniref:Uncharacterized protein n=1 Tax=Lithospermum erythrorhizon TaxID=34254 RepID=A0AAV3PTH7_LITER